MLWLTSISFVLVALRARRVRKHLSTALFSALACTSVIHHGSLADILFWDKLLAHIAGVWGLFQGVKQNKVRELVPYGVWAPVAYYVIQPKLPSPILKDVVHASIHVVSTVGFIQLL